MKCLPPLTLSRIWHLKTQRQTVNPHQGYGDFHQRGRKSWLFFDGHSLWTVKKTTTAIIRFSHKRSDIRKVFSSMKGFSQQSTVLCFCVCSVWQPSFGQGFFKSAVTPALFSWDLQEIMSCVFWIQPQCYVSSPTLVLVLFLAAHWHLQSCLKGDIRFLWSQCLLWVPQSPSS